MRGRGRDPQHRRCPLTAFATCIFGTPGAGLNLGVGALRDATVHAVRTARPQSAVTVFDDGWGVRTAASADGPVELCGGRASRRWHRPESFAQMRVALALGGLGNAGAQRLRAASVVLDVSGGDSFSDLYGRHRFETVAWPKRLALAAGRPLVLLPQTYGPFRDPQVRDRAARLLRRATQVWARDEESRAAADALIGEPVTRLGVDMAFGLAPTAPPDEVAERWDAWFAAHDAPVAGINVNGLLVGEPGAAQRYGVGAEHADAMAQVAATVLETSDWRVAVVPHVLGDRSADSDVAVCRRVAADLVARFGADRVLLAEGGRTAGETKWLLARCSWFTGARMHATIGAASSGVPTAGVAYSLKMAPLLGALGQPVVDARGRPGAEVAEELVGHWQRRASAAAALAAALPPVLATWRRQADEIVAAGDER